MGRGRIAVIGRLDRGALVRATCSWRVWCSHSQFTIYEGRAPSCSMRASAGPPKLVRQHAHRAESLRLRPFGAGMVQPIAQW